MNAAPDALAAALACEGSQRMDEVAATVRRFSAPSGFDRFVLFSASAVRDALVDRIYWIEGEWTADGEALDADTYLRHCPVSRHVLATDQPFFWTKTQHQDGERYRIVQRPRGAGLHGLQLPVFGPLGLEGAMTLAGTNIDASRHTRLGLSVLAIAAFHAARRLLQAPVAVPRGALTVREREVLAWIAAGRRQSDVAGLLGLSERTIENHLRRVRARLGVATTAQAVTVAIRHGFIAR